MDMIARARTEWQTRLLTTYLFERKKQAFLLLVDFFGGMTVGSKKTSYHLLIHGSWSVSILQFQH